MNSSTDATSLTNDRKNTDASLIAEREEATNRLLTANSRTQIQTDKIVQDERAIADEKTAASRMVHDDNRPSAMNNNAAAASECQIKEERRKTDLATDLERVRVDAALLLERELAYKDVSSVLNHERTATDDHLLMERKTTDKQELGSSHKLKIELTEHEKTKESLTTRDEFLAIVSHDLRNPIGAIRGYAELLLDKSGGANLNAEAAQYAQAIERSADVSLRLISDLLDVERITQRKLELLIKPVSALDLLTEVEELFSPAALEKNIAFSIGKVDSKMNIDCDHDRIFQVLVNLVGNAIKFTPKNGSIVLDVQSRGPEAEFTVTDSGGGIAEEKLRSVFERFAQIGEKDRSGLGLGLYIAKMLVEAHGGRIWVESTLGVGSKFKFAMLCEGCLSAPVHH